MKSQRELILENNKLREANRRLQTEGPALERDKLIMQLRAELEAARKVADAAVGWIMAYTLKMRFIMAEAAGDAEADRAYRLMVGVVFEAQNAFADAVAEYRALDAPLSPGKRAVIERTVDKTDEEWEELCKQQ
jgi:hypothetical protein